MILKIEELALATGRLVKYSMWKTSDTRLSLQIDGDNFAISHYVEYPSISLAALVGAKSEERSNENF